MENLFTFTRAVSEMIIYNSEPPKPSRPPDLNKRGMEYGKTTKII